MSRYPFVAVPNEPNIFVSLVNPHRICDTDTTTHKNITNVVVFPSDVLHYEPDFPMAFEYLVLPGLYNQMGWSRRFYYEEMRDAVEWIRIRADIRNEPVLLVDESRGREGASLLLLSFLTLKRIGPFDDAKTFVENEILRCPIEAPECLLEWTRSFYHKPLIPGTSDEDRAQSPLRFEILKGIPKKESHLR